MNTRLSEPTNRRTLRAMARFAAPFLAVLALLSLSLSSSSPAQAQTAPVMTIYPPASVSEGAFGLAFSLEWDPGLIEDPTTVKVEVSETGNMLAAGEAGIRSLPCMRVPFIGAEVLVSSRRRQRERAGQRGDGDGAAGRWLHGGRVGFR